MTDLLEAVAEVHAYLIAKADDPSVMLPDDDALTSVLRGIGYMLVSERQDPAHALVEMMNSLHFHMVLQLSVEAARRDQASDAATSEVSDA